MTSLITNPWILSTGRSPTLIAWSGRARQHHIRLILDMVLNHTSDKHSWFLEASASRTSAHHDFYMWNDGKTGSAGERLEGAGHTAALRRPGRLELKPGVPGGAAAN
jgi:glycosidase